jgi:type IV pilus assembly protein PilW
MNKYPVTSATGMSLVELMVALAIGSMLMLGLVTTFSNSSQAQRELEKASQLIENGRYAIDLIFTDLHHAGYYGHFYSLEVAPAALPDPCETSSTGNLEAALAMPVQGYRGVNGATLAASTIADIDHSNTCEAALLVPANLNPGSDILVVRRADTAIFTGTPTVNEVYIQSNRRTARILKGVNASQTVDGTVVASQTVDNQNQDLRKYPGTSNTNWADTRKYHVHVYFVAPCSFGSGSNGVCQSGDDQIPTLKRLELVSDGANTVMEIVPLVEGIEFLKFEYGIDASPAAVNALTGQQGDGVPDSYVLAPSIAQWPQVTAVKVTILARTISETRGHADTKVYTLPGGIYDPNPDDAFKRHIYSTEVQPLNMAGRREIP